MTERKIKGREGKEKIAEAGASGDNKTANVKSETTSETKPKVKEDGGLTEKKIPATATQEATKISECQDKRCHIHGNLKIRGRTFEGVVIKKFHKRVVIEFERMVYVKKYERYKKSRTKIHARLQECMEDEIKVRDYIKIRECRPLSKLIHFVVIEKIKSGGEGK